MKQQYVRHWGKRWLICCLLMATIACDGGQGETDSLTNADSGKPRVALIIKSLANEFFINMAAGAEAHQLANNEQYELSINGIKNESDLAQQVSLVEQMMATGVNIIVLAPADSKGLLPVINRAVSQGIIVVNIDNKFDSELLTQMKLNIPFVGPDNREGAKMVGDYLATFLKSGDQVAIIGGIPSAFNAQQRQAGFEDAMKASGIDVVSIQSGDWEQAKAAAVASALLAEHPNLKALLCANDSMALGAVAAVRQAGRIGAVEVVGFDNISAANKLVESGELLATADQHGDQLAVFGIKYALQILDTGAVPADRKTPVDLITTTQE